MEYVSYFYLLLIWSYLKLKHVCLVLRAIIESFFVLFCFLPQSVQAMQPSSQSVQYPAVSYPQHLLAVSPPHQFPVVLHIFITFMWIDCVVWACFMYGGICYPGKEREAECTSLLSYSGTDTGTACHLGPQCLAKSLSWKWYKMCVVITWLPKSASDRFNIIACFILYHVHFIKSTKDISAPTTLTPYHLGFPLLFLLNNFVHVSTTWP